MKYFFVAKEKDGLFEGYLFLSQKNIFYFVAKNSPFFCLKKVFFSTETDFSMSEVFCILPVLYTHQLTLLK